VTEEFVLELAEGFLEPLSRSHPPHTISRIALLKDGTTRPVLRLLAERKFGPLSRDALPFWIDGDPNNETLANVALAQKPYAPPPRRVRKAS